MVKINSFIFEERASGLVDVMNFFLFKGAGWSLK